MRNLRIVGVLGLGMALAIAGCGQADTTAQATLIVQSVPQAEIFVDGVSQGESGSELSLGAGTHRIELRLEKFESFETTVTLAAGATETIDASLRAQDPSDPVVIAKLGEAEGIEIAPFAAPQVTRGGRRKSVVATLLWPSRDIRKAGLVNYAIEANETYGGDATLEFRQGRRVLYRKTFNPESLTTVRRLPSTVMEKVKIGSKITWGLYFEDRRRPITAEFHVVNRPKADRQLEKLGRSRHMARQPKITQEIMAATVLENNRLFTEALVANIEISENYPNSTQPYRGIVTTLRRLDAEDSELFAFVSPYVGGKGGRAAVRRTVSTMAGVKGLGINAWTAPAARPVAAATAGTGSTGTARAGGQGLTPSGGQVGQPQTTPGTAEATPGTTTPTQETAAGLLAERVRNELAQAEERSRLAVEALGTAQNEATEAQAAAGTAQAQAESAAEAVAEARTAIAEAEEPTSAQHEQLAQAQREAEAAEQAAEAARATASDAQKHAGTLEAAAAELAGTIQEHERSLQDALRNDPTSNDPTSNDPASNLPADQPTAGGETQPDLKEKKTPAVALSETELRGTLEAAAQGASESNTALDAARVTLEAAAQAHAASPTEETHQAMQTAREALESAALTAEQAQKDMDSARQALERLNSQAAPASTDDTPSKGK